MCGFSHDTRRSDFLWTVVDGYYALNQGLTYIPTEDHTTGMPAGSFLYLDAHEQSEGKRAVLVSEIVDETSEPRCLQFYMYTNKYNKARLRVNLTNARTGDTTTELYTSNTYNGDGWLLAAVQLPYGNKRQAQSTTTTSSSSSEKKKNKKTTNIFYPYAFTLEGLAGKTEGNLNELAIDDILVTRGTCNANTDTKATFDCRKDGTELVPVSAVCNFVRECSNGADEFNCGTCDFERDDWCGWSDNSIGNGARWTRVNNRTRPSEDHTFGNASGHYMSLVSKRFGYEDEDRARLVSPVMQQAGASCQFTYWYRNLRAVDFFAQLWIGGRSKAMLAGHEWQTSHSQMWYTETVHLGRVNGQFQIVFEAYVQLESAAYLAIDDISFENCALPALSTAGM